MRHLSSGVVACTTAWALVGCAAPGGPCNNFCGAGTECRDNVCVVAKAQPEPQLDAEPEPDKKKRRRRRRRKGGGGDSSPAAGGLPYNDGAIPRYRADRLENIGEGTERLSDRRVRQELSTVEPDFNNCLSRASALTDAELSGQVTFQIGIEPSGKVWGVNARVPSSWDVPGLRACFRNAVYDHRFPSWDGQPMGVDYHFRVD